MSSQKLNVAIVGLSFGAEFIPIYQAHENANMYAICQRNEESLKQIGDAYNIATRYTDYEELLKDPKIDIVHINTPPFMHADQTVAALEAGKHAACTIPMAMSVEDCRRIVEAQEKSGKTYMMMETVVYSREYLYVKELFDKGEMGKLQFLRSSHQQDMAGWPGYWEGLPPMYNATHAISPTLAIGGNEAESVQCIGSGTIDKSMHAQYGSPFCIESAHIKFKDSDLYAEVTRSLFDVARQYRESFDVHCSKKSFEWSLIEDDGHIIHTGESPERVEVPDYAHRLPESIAHFTTKGVYDDENTHLSFSQGGGHGGSHPHLVHELLDAIVNNREAYPNARQGANITCSGILAHESALNEGKKIMLPEWTLANGPKASAYAPEAELALAK
ncbi:Gfo/Idh/MocA family oxidoreductase [Lentisphaera marina]|uniref:Gfo/Idh/MocA family protein n=1 Tax=Lentisphaera marina TaxID=1111041 RepID=UPI002366BD91|nr:Gfo/Idh/MocA family oxidoreductase [Lentisphaera marina]MDD7987247.1 Gfo/Idh/MocA family oxidoreductase [Lentisphaera marina]